MKLLSKWLKTKRFWLIFSAVIFCIGITAGGVGISAHLAKNKASDFKSEFTIPVDNADTHADADVWDGSTKTAPSGSGTEADPYIIASAANLAYLSNNYSSYSGKYFKQTVDIDLNSKSWTPINPSSSYYYYYDGYGHTISKLYVSTSFKHAGLFGYVTGGYIRNLGIESGSVTTSSSSSWTAAGGILGYIKGISSQTMTISNCYNKASVSISAGGFYSAAGGIVGFSYYGNSSSSSCTVSYCYNTGSVSCRLSSGESYPMTGGIMGHAYNDTSSISNQHTISYCYNTGSVSASSSSCIGGILGDKAYLTPTVSYCYYLSTCGGTNSYGTSLSASAMKSTANGQAPSGMSGFTTSNWTFASGSYPTLRIFSATKVVTKPTLSATYFAYTGSSQSVTVNNYNTSYMTRSGTVTLSATSVGTYSAGTYTLSNLNYCWEDGSGAAVSLSWSIRTVISTIPSQSGTLTYSGSSQSPSWSNYSSSKLTIGGTTSGTNAGSYTATFTPTSNYMWSDGTITAKSVRWTIGRAATATKPTATPLTFTYSGESQGPTVSGYDSSKMRQGGTSSATNAGTYSITFYLTSNYMWTDNTTSTYSISWTITKANRSSSKTFSMSGYTYGGTKSEPTLRSDFSWTVTNLSTDYGFALNSDGYYESNNQGVHNSYALCKVSFTLSSTQDVGFTLISSGENSCDFGIFSDLDTTLTSNYSVDSSNVKQSYYRMSSTSTQTLTYSNVSAGLHFITIKYRKDGSVNSGNDSLQFTIGLPTTYYYNTTNSNSGGTLWGSVTSSTSLNVGTYYMYAVFSETNYNSTTSTVVFTISRGTISTPSQSGTLTYNGSSQSPSWNNYNASQLTIGGTYQNQINAGSYTATFTPTSNYQWSGGSTTAQNVAWTINRATVAKPTATPTEFDFNGEVRQPSITGYNGEKMTQDGIASEINAGKYELTFTPNQNYQWTDGGTSTHSISWTINKITVNFPTLNEKSFQYTGEMWVPQVSEYNQNIISQSGESRAKDVGNYTITFNLLYPSSSQWDDGTVDSYSVGWVITKASVNMPTAPANLTYNGSSQSPDFGTNFDSSKMTKTGDTSGINAGVYVTAITPTQNYQWSDGTSATLVFKWEILRLGVETPSVSGTYTYTGSVQTVVLSNYSASTMELTGVQSATEAGTYVVSIMPDTNHKWASTGGIGVVQLSWTIKKQVVDTPTLVGGTTLEDGSVAFAFTSLDITPTLNNFTSTYMEKTGAIKGKRAFTYYMIVSINDANKNNYVFANGRDFVVITWTITPYELTDENTTITTGK